MNNSMTYSRVSAVMLFAFSLLLLGCGTTDSDTDPDLEDPDDDETQSETFNSGDVDSDETFSYTFENEGEFEYYCTYHEDMQGEIVVSSEAEPVERDTVIMEGMSFDPASLTVAPNTEVVWINESSLVHTVTSGTPNSGGSGGGDY